MTRDDLGARLRAAREAAGLSQAEAAAKLRSALKRRSFTRPNVGYAESGARRVSVDELPAFASVYGTTVEALLGTGAPGKIGPAERRRAATEPEPARKGPPPPTGASGDLVVAAMRGIRSGGIVEERFDDE